MKDQVVTSPERNSYRPDIDGLRAIAIVSVVVYHYSAALLPGGYLGVDIFFVISGFLITSHIHRDLMDGRFSFIGFYARRFRRILPALICVIAVTSLIAVFLLSPLELMRYVISAAASLLGVSNLDFFRSLNYFAPSAERQLLLMTWSLGIEEQFYVVLPICLGIIHRFRPAWTLPGVALLTLLSLLLYGWGQAHMPTAAFFLLPFRAWELGFGAVLALATARGALKGLTSATHQALLSTAGLGLLIAGLLLAASANELLRSLANPAAAVGAVALIASPEAPINRRLLSLRPLVGTGLISYSLYLWHWPLLAALKLASPDGLGLPQTLLLAGVTLGLAVLSWAFVERPFRRRLEPSDRKTVLVYAAVTGSLIVPLGLIFATHGLERLAPPALARAERYATLTSHDPCLVSYGISAPPQTPACGRSGNKPAIAIIGDSHASALAPALREQAQAHGSGFVQMTKASCAPLSGYTRYMPDHKGHDAQCAAFMASAFERIDADPAIRTVILAGYWAAPLEEAGDGARFIAVNTDGQDTSPAQSRENLKAGLLQAVSRLKAAGREVIVLQDVPHFAFDPMDRLKRNNIPMRGFLHRLLTGEASPPSAPMTTALMATAREDAARPLVAEAAAGATRLVDPWRDMCTDALCRYGDAHDLYYVDPQHLSLPGARQIAGGLNLKTY